VSGDALPSTSNWTSLVRSILRYFKSGFQPRDEFVEQIEILPDHRLNLSEVVSRQTPEYAFPGRDEIQEEFVDLQDGTISFAIRSGSHGGEQCSREQGRQTQGSAIARLLAA
jgi:hypothetical protein